VDLGGLLAILLALLTVFWLLLGGPSRRRERKVAARFRGGRTAKDRSFFGLLARDRAYRPGAVLAALTIIELARTVGSAGVVESGLTTSAGMLAFVVAVGFVVRPDIVGAGMGLLGIVALTVRRLGLEPCEGGVQHDNVRWVLFSAGFLVVAFGLRLIVPQVRSGHRIFRGGGISSLWSPGVDRGPGAVGGTILTVFGVMELADVLLRPELPDLVESILPTGGAAVMLAGVAVLAVGVALLPEFTTSVTGLLVVAAGLLALLSPGPVCLDVGTTLVAGGVFAAGYLLGRRFG
jgi:hypothetical protein